MQTKRSLSINFLTQLFGKALTVIIGLGLTMILAQALGKEGYGEYTTAITFLQIFGVIVDFGLTLTLASMLSEKDANESKIAGNIFGLRMTSAILMFSIAPLIALPFPWSNTVRLAVLIGAFAYILMAGSTMLIGIFQKHGSIWQASLAELISRIILIGSFAILAWFHFGLLPMMLATVVANGAWLILMMFFAKKFIAIRPRFDFSVWKSAIKESWPIAVSILFNLLYLKGDILFLSSFRGTAEVGLYGLAYRLIDISTSIPTMFMGLILPTLVSDWSNGKKEHFLDHMRSAFVFFMIIICPIVAGVQIVAEPAIAFIGGPGFEQAADVLKLLIWCIPGVFLGALYGHTVIALKKQKTMIWAFASVALFTIIGYLWLIPIYGMWGAAIMTVASETIIAVLGWVIVFKESRSAPLLFLPLKTLGSAFVMWFILSRFPNLSIFISIPLGALIYGVMLFITGSIDLKTIKMLQPEKPGLTDNSINY